MATPKLVPAAVPPRPAPRRRPAGRRTTWRGGIIRYDKEGTPHYYLWRKTGGERYRLSLGVTSEEAAEIELARWEKAVSEGRGKTYRPGEAEGPEPVWLESKLVEQYLGYSAEKENSKRWRKQQRGILAWWTEKLAGRNLAGGVTLDRDILPALEGTYKASRIRVLKALFAWLREVRLRITPDQDPTYGGRLKAPQTKSAQASGEKTVRSRDDYRAVWNYLRKKKADHWADALIILAGTGWHLTELDRFSTMAGRILVPPTRTNDAWAILETPHKGKHTHRSLVSRVVHAAAKRHKKRDLILDSNKDFYAAIRVACRKVRVKRFTPGVSRHSVATWAVEAGADSAAVSTYLGHKTQATTKKFYATFATPKKVPTLV